MFNLVARGVARRSAALAATSRPTALAPSRLAAVPASRLLSSLSDGDKMKGTVKWFDTKKGFGFILPDDPDTPDVFVHQTSIHASGFRTLADGESVEFETITEANGRVKATNVTGPDGAYVQGSPPPSRDDYD